VDEDIAGIGKESGQFAGNAFVHPAVGDAAEDLFRACRYGCPTHQPGQQRRLDEAHCVMRVLSGLCEIRAQLAHQRPAGGGVQQSEDVEAHGNLPPDFPFRHACDTSKFFCRRS